MKENQSSEQAEFEMGHTMKISRAELDLALGRATAPSPADDLCSAFNAVAWSSATDGSSD